MVTDPYTCPQITDIPIKTMMQHATIFPTILDFVFWHHVS